MITFEEWWLMQFLPKEHRYASEQAWNNCHREMEQLSNLRVAEVIANKQATIDRLTEQRRMLVDCIKDIYVNKNLRRVEPIRQLIAEIETGK